MQKQKIILISISPNDIIAGKTKQIVNVLWNIMRALLLRGIGLPANNSDKGQGEEKTSLRATLLTWCTTAVPNIEISDFWASFRDGLALCTIVDRLAPGKIDLQKIKRENAEANLQLAFQVAEECLGIPALLTPQDVLTGQKDEKALMNYIGMLVSATIHSQKKV